jgi:hypothetical protein
VLIACVFVSFTVTGDLEMETLNNPDSNEDL